MSRPIIIGVAGGSGSGKTTVVRALLDSQGSKHLTVIEQDAYYKNQTHLTYAQRCLVNYDHPEAFDNDLLVKHLNMLVNQQPIAKPIYNFTTHLRETDVETITPHEIIVVEGILILENAALRDLMDIKIFVDTDADVRVLRRIKRDIQKRGRSLDSVINQYLHSVRPMHLQFVEPTKKYADIIIPEGGKNQVAIDILCSKLSAIINSIQGREKRLS